ncbi:ribonuclease H family protein [Anaeropeptidivorans aminofermentans]|uniref:hypothetical protein n=1 Tax=Anaeropeptidivorans aminofermentans TaxID=2934315 RepID=UPI002024F8C9|nr:hypothetical protein [Anaeropeptidivorans aminofermentans]
MMIDYDEAVLSLAASFDCNTSTYSFGYVIKYGEHPMESYSHKDNKGEYAKEGAIAGLVSGISKGINRANWRNYYKITICHNSEVLQKWVTGSYKAKSNSGKRLKKILMDPMLNLNFVLLKNADRDEAFSTAKNLAQRCIKKSLY